MKTTGLLRSFAFLFCLGALAACDSSDNSTSPAPETPSAGTPDDSPGTLLDVARDSGSFDTLVTALEAAGLDATLADESANSRFLRQLTMRLPHSPRALSMRSWPTRTCFLTRCFTT